MSDEVHESRIKQRLIYHYPWILSEMIRVFYLTKSIRMSWIIKLYYLPHSKFTEYWNSHFRSLNVNRLLTANNFAQINWNPKKSYHTYFIFLEHPDDLSNSNKFEKKWATVHAPKSLYFKYIHHAWGGGRS